MMNGSVSGWKASDQKF